MRADGTKGAAQPPTLTERGLLLTAAWPAPPRLEDLLAGVTRRNMHAEVDIGPAAGREAW